MILKHFFAKNYAIFLFSSVCLGVILTWIVQIRLEDFKQYQLTIATNSVNAVSNQIVDLINKNRKLITLFVQQEEPLLQNLVKSPNSEKLRQQFGQRISAYFPNYFDYVIANQAGIIIPKYNYKILLINRSKLSKFLVTFPNNTFI